MMACQLQCYSVGISPSSLTNRKSTGGSGNMWQRCAAAIGFIVVGHLHYSKDTHTHRVKNFDE